MRGTLSRKILMKKNINVNEIYDDPVLLLSRFYMKWKIKLELYHINLYYYYYKYYSNNNNIDLTLYYLISQTDRCEMLLIIYIRVKQFLVLLYMV